MSANLRPAVVSAPKAKKPRKPRETKRQRGYITWSPYKVSLQRLEWVEAVLAEYQKYLPLTIRQVFYRLVAKYAYPKDENAYGRLCETLNKARRAKLISFDDIRDDGVSVMRNAGYDSIKDFHDETALRARSYKRDRQYGQSYRVELWCEAAGMMPQLDLVASKYSIPVYSNGGFSSLTAVRNIVDRAVSCNEPTIFLHVGDYDPSGESVFDAMSRDVVAFVEADRVLATTEVIPERVALTSKQVARYGLPTAPPKKSDSRTKGWHAQGKGGTCQVESLTPSDLALIVENAILDWIDLDTYEEVLEMERGERAQLLGLPRGDDREQKLEQARRLISGEDEPDELGEDDDGDDLWGLLSGEDASSDDDEGER